MCSSNKKDICNKLCSMKFRMEIYRNLNPELLSFVDRFGYINTRWTKTEINLFIIKYVHLKI